MIRKAGRILALPLLKFYMDLLLKELLPSISCKSNEARAPSLPLLLTGLYHLTTTESNVLPTVLKRRTVHWLLLLIGPLVERSVNVRIANS